MRRVPVILVGAVVLAAVVAGTAAAALALVFSRTAGAAGDPVSVRTRGTGALRGVVPRKGDLRLFLVPASVAGSVRSAADPRLLLLGTLKVDRRGNGSLAFRTPNVLPGSYTTLLACKACAPRPAGRSIRPAGPFPGPFRILDGPPRVRTCASSVSGTIPPESTARALRAGSLTLYPLGDLTPRAVTGRRGYYETTKLLAEVRGAAGLTVSVAPEDRAFVGLLYTPDAASGNALRVADGDPAVAFEPCAGQVTTQFNGGFVVAGPRCAHLEVRLTPGAEPILLGIPFGRPCSSAS